VNFKELNLVVSNLKNIEFSDIKILKNKNNKIMIEFSYIKNFKNLYH